ncbi:MAG: hypothetical protein QNK25_10465 [Desulfobacterales bacterium]|nr:hypothetical protein [Desulfobacterales bacterium]
MNYDISNSILRDALKNRIAETCGKLRSLLQEKDHLSATSILRDYVYRSIIWSDDQINLDLFSRNNMYDLDLQQILYLLDSREIGVLCGGASLLLKKVYQLFGYTSETYNYGFSSTDGSYSPTHVTTLVEIEHGGEKQIVLQDPTFNMTLFNAANSNYDFICMLEAVSKGAAESIQVKKGAQRPVPIFLKDDAMAKDVLRYYIDSGVLRPGDIERAETSITNTSIIGGRGDLDYQRSYLSRREADIKKVLKKNTGKPEENCTLYDLLLYPLGDFLENFPFSRKKEIVRYTKAR